MRHPTPRHLSPLWDMDLSLDFRHGLTRFLAPKDETWGWPLYGYQADQMCSRSCCAWADFIGSFVYKWNDKFNTDPHPEIVKQARTLWKRWSMTGVEAFITIMQKARLQ